MEGRSSLPLVATTLILAGGPDDGLLSQKQGLYLSAAISRLGPQVWDQVDGRKSHLENANGVQRVGWWMGRLFTQDEDAAGWRRPTS